MEKFTNGGKIRARVFPDEGSRNFSKEFNSWAEANRYAERCIELGETYKVEVFHAERLTFTNDKNYLKKIRGEK